MVAKRGSRFNASIKRWVNRLFQRTVRWVSLVQVQGVHTASLEDAESIPAPLASRVPFIINTRSANDAGLSLPEPQAALLKNVLYSPTYQTVFLSRHRILTDTVSAPPYIFRFPIQASQLYKRNLTPLPGYATSLRGRWNSYYHTLIEVAPRLEMLRHDYFRRFSTIQLLVPGGLNENERFLLNKLDVPSNMEIFHVDKSRLYQPEHYIYLSFATRSFCGHLPTSSRTRLREALLPRRHPRRSHRILISRQKAGTRRILNFEELLDALEPIGFEAYVLEVLSLEEQIALFYDADAVVGVHGAGLTNLLFGNQVRVVELFPNQFVIPHFYYLCQSLGHPYRYWLPGAADYTFDVNMHRHEILKHLPNYRDRDVHVDIPTILDELQTLGVK